MTSCRRCYGEVLRVGCEVFRTLVQQAFTKRIWAEKTRAEMQIFIVLDGVYFHSLDQKRIGYRNKSTARNDGF